MDNKDSLLALFSEETPKLQKNNEIKVKTDNLNSKKLDKSEKAVSTVVKKETKKISSVQTLTETNKQAVNDETVKKPVQKKSVSAPKIKAYEEKPQSVSHTENDSRREIQSRPHPMIKKDNSMAIKEKETVQTKTKSVQNPDRKNHSASVSKGNDIETSKKKSHDSTQNKAVPKQRSYPKEEVPFNENPAEKMSLAEKTIKTLKENEKIDEAVGKAYREIKHKSKRPEKESQKSKKKPKRHEKRGYSQDIVPVKAINNGIIQTTTGQYVKILEILPVNFKDKTVSEQGDIARTFASVFHNGPVRVKIKCITDKSNPERIINNIKEQCEREKWQRGISDKLVACAQDIIIKAKNISETSALTRRYFLIYRYEGSSTDVLEIVNDIETTKTMIKATFASAGNIVMDYGYDKASYEAGEILYYFFNRKTCRKESFQQRIDRILSDAEFYNESSGKKKKKDVLDADLVAGKGIYFFRDYAYMDGMYKTYLALKSKGHPNYALPGWLSPISSLADGTEIDVDIERLPHDITYSALEQYTRVKTSGNENRRNSQKQREIYNQAANNRYITSRMEADEDIYNVVITFTIAAETIRDLRKLKSSVIKLFNRQRRYVEDCYENVGDFYNATLPLLEMPSAMFKRNRRNYLSSSLSTLYMFTTEECCDPTGSIVGIDENSSLVAINPFNTDLYPNANISIYGMTGSGKTFSTQILARAKRIIGQRVFCILPIKAYEYQHGTNAVDGTYIVNAPGSKQRINICAIIPEMNIDKDVLREESFTASSLLSTKISFLVTWLELNMETQMTIEEMDLLEGQLARLYSDFGITDDNSSIYDRNGKLKPMPILSDIYERIREIPELRNVTRALKKYVVGQCQSMNGPTNVDLTNKYIVFDTDKSSMNSRLIVPYMYAAMHIIYCLIKQSRLYQDTLIIDEGWEMLDNPRAAAQIKEMVKVIRGYGGSIIFATQEINDCLRTDAGKSIISGTAIKIIMYMEPDACRDLAKVIGLSESDVKQITKFRRGQAMIITKHGKTIVDIIPSEKEKEDFTTDSNELQAIERKRQGLRQ